MTPNEVGTAAIHDMISKHGIMRSALRSPPRVRGKVVRHAHGRNQHGITPARAGKRMTGCWNMARQ